MRFTITHTNTIDMLGKSGSEKLIDNAPHSICLQALRYTQRRIEYHPPF